MSQLSPPAPEATAASWRPTLDSALRIACRLHRERIAMTWGGVELSYGQLEAAAEAMAAAFRERGVRPGDRVLCRLPNRPEQLLSAAAAWRCGAIHVAADRDLTIGELRQLVERVEPRLLLVEEATDRLIAGLAAAKGSRPELLDCGAPGWLTCAPAAVEWSTAGPADLEPLTQVHPGAAPDDPAVILTTSGTTGEPRHVLRDHGELALRWWSSAVRLEAAPGEAHLVQLPLWHGFGLGMAIGGLLTGGRLVLMERFSAEAALRLVERHRIGVLNGAPPHFQLILDRLAAAGRRRPDVSSLRAGCGSGAIFPTELLRRILDELGLRFTLSYGCSEGLGWGTSDPETIRRGSVGRPPADRFRIVDAHGRGPVPPDGVGEIAILRTEPVRYWGDRGRQTRAGDWYLTGDTGRLDADGCLHVLGRVGDQICRGGIWVEPGEVEEGLREHPGLVDVAVIGLPDPVLGEHVCACLVPSGKAPELEELRTWLADRLARFKLPEAIRVVPAIPRSALGKVDRPALRRLALHD